MYGGGYFTIYRYISKSTLNRVDSFTLIEGAILWPSCIQPCLRYSAIFEVLSLL